jgi:hypothetical protein
MFMNLCVAIIFIDFYFPGAGPIPETIGQLKSLTMLMLRCNKLSGSFIVTADV